jgi:hypothetical protein
MLGALILVEVGGIAMSILTPLLTMTQPSKIA